MGQKQINPYSEYQKDYTLVSQTQKDELLIRHKQNGKQYMLRKVIVKSQQELQQRMKLLNRRRKIKSEHLLSIVNFKPINSDRICGNALYISLLIEYPFQSLLDEKIHRLSQPTVSARGLSARSSPLYFQEHELWSILYSCVLGLEALYMNDMAHESISKSMIFVDKDGVVKIGDPILLGARTNYDRVIEQFENQKRKKEDSQNSSNYGQQTPAKPSLQKINQATENSFIVSPQLISLCKDHQYYFFDKEKSDVFVMGAIMIQLGMLEDVASVNTKDKVFKTDLSQYFSQKGKLAEKYSPTFLSIIQSMVNIDPKKRPTLSQIVEKIQEFSIQQNTNSQQNSFKKTQTEPQQTPEKYEPVLKGYSLNNQFDIKAGEYTSLGYGSKGLQNNTFKSSYLQPVSSIDSVNLLLNTGTNPITHPVAQGLNYQQFPSFSIQPLSQGQNLKPIQGYQESAVKSLFSKKLPIQIKYAQSPLIVPVSNMRLKENEQTLPKREFSTPFDNLNLTESNEKKVIGRTVDKQSIVQNKFTLFGSNSLDANNLFAKPNQSQERKPYSIATERFSFQNFGKIEIPTNSQNTSLNTSTLPTPRFQNPFSTNSNLNLNNVTKPSFTPTFHNLNSSNYGANSFNNSTYMNPSNTNTNFNTYIQSNTSIDQANSGSQNSIQKKVNGSSYDPKRQGFSISDNAKHVESYSVDQSLEPYFHNSSVGYTLPKYRPQSTSSEVVYVSVQQKIKRSQSKQSTHSVKNINNISPTKKIMQQSESIMHRQDSPPKQLIDQHNLNSASMINSVTQEKIETNSNTSTVKKQVHSSRKNSGKKYNFYKRELNQKLQKIEQPLPIMSKEIQKPAHSQQQSPILGQNLNLSYSQNTLTQVDFEPEIHSVYVEQREENGSFYRGYKLNNQRHGNGVLVFADSGFYEGQFNHDQMEGYGKLFYNQRDLAYEGQFKQNCFNGHGILYNNRPEELNGRFDFANLANINNYWVSYDGYFKEDQKSGKCHIRFTNGEQFEGYCQNNTFEGKGKFKTIDGSYVEGIWKNNVLIEIQEDSQVPYPNQ